MFRQDDVADNAYNIYRCYVHLYGRDAQLSLVSDRGIASVSPSLVKGRFYLRAGGSSADASQATQYQFQESCTSSPIGSHVPPGYEHLHVPRAILYGLGADKWIFPTPIFDEESFREKLQDPGHK